MKSHTEVRAAIGAKKSGNADGAKGGRKANASSQRSTEAKPRRVARRRGAHSPMGEVLLQRYKAERRIWSEKMLMALERGVKGGRWFSLNDKIEREETLSLAWEKVESNVPLGGTAWTTSP